MSKYHNDICTTTYLVRAITPQRSSGHWLGCMLSRSHNQDIQRKKKNKLFLHGMFRLCKNVRSYFATSLFYTILTMATGKSWQNYSANKNRRQCSIKPTECMLCRNGRGHFLQRASYHTVIVSLKRLHHFQPLQLMHITR